MGKFYEEIPENVMDWVVKQKVFWVSTAPLSKHGHVNVSPKGGECFGVPNRKSFWYMDMTGSGNETISHLLEPGNGRITILFNAFEGPPRILRFWGKGRVLEYGTPEFDAMVAREKIRTMPGTRSVIVVDIHQVGTSCGYQVPFFSFVDHRRTLEDHFRKQVERHDGPDERREFMDRYWALKNAWSMDGLPGMRRGLRAGRRFAVEPMTKMVGKLAPKNGAGGGAVATAAELHVAYAVIALLVVLVAALAATHPAFQYFPVQKRMQTLIAQVTSLPNASLSGTGLL